MSHAMMIKSLTVVVVIESYSAEKCDDDKDFDCVGDGSQCIALESRCNQVIDCENGQDENMTVCATIRKLLLHILAHSSLTR